MGKVHRNTRDIDTEFRYMRAGDKDYRAICGSSGWATTRDECVTCKNCLRAMNREDGDD